MSEDFRHSARITLVGEFFKIAQLAFEQYYQLEKKIDTLKAKGTFEDSMDVDGNTYKWDVYLEVVAINQLESSKQREFIKCVIFIATFLESYIWEVSAIVFGNNYAQNHFDKLGTVSKWEIIPKMISGKSVSISDQDLGVFRKLIRVRNDIIHHKSKDFHTVRKKLERGEHQLEPVYALINLKEVFSFVDSLFTALDQVYKPGWHLASLNLFKQKDET